MPSHQIKCPCGPVLQHIRGDKYVCPDCRSLYIVEIRKIGYYSDKAAMLRKAEKEQANAT